MIDVSGLLSLLLTLLCLWALRLLLLHGLLLIKLTRHLCVILRHVDHYDKNKKLPSGSWRVIQYTGKDTGSKRVYKSFTTTSKKEAIVYGENNEVYVKKPKSTAGDCTLDMPKIVADALKRQPRTSEYVVNIDSSGIYKRFTRLLKNNDIPHFRFHDLRHPYVKATTKILSYKHNTAIHIKSEF